MSKLRATFFVGPFTLFAFVVFSVAACSVPSDGDPSEDAVSTGRAELRDPCATVRCAAGTHCVSKGKRAECVADTQACRQDSDCRPFDNYCDGCACQAISIHNPNPVCTGATVQCFAQPCG